MSEATGKATGTSRAVLAILLIVLVVRVAGALFIAPDVVSDAQGYDAAAIRLLRTGSYAYPVPTAAYWKWHGHRLVLSTKGRRALLSAPPNAFTMPGYPVFLAAVYRVLGFGGWRWVTVRVVQSILSVATLGLVFLVARRLGPKIGLVAVLLAAIYPPLTMENYYILTEALSTLLLLGFVYLFLEWLDHPRASLALAAGVVFGLGLWVRPAVAFWLIPASVAIFAIAQHNRVRVGAQLIMVAAVAALVLSPWWVRNETLYHRFVPFTTNASITVAEGFRADSAREALFPWQRVARRHITEDVKIARIIGTAQAATPQDALGDTGFLALDKTSADMTRRLVTEHPMEVLQGRARSIAVSVLRPSDVSPRVAGGVPFAVTFAIHMALLALFVLGVLVLPRRLDAWLLLSIPVYFLVFHALVLPLERYYLPAAPILLIVSAVGLNRFLPRRSVALANNAPPPLVSILTPSFNQAAWLPDNLRSVASQTYPCIEHVLMDGGSTDGTLALLEAAGESVRWRSEPDRGQADALNKAFAESRGDIIGWINSDDAYFDCDVIARVVAYFAEHPDVDVVFGHCAQTTAEGRLIQILWAPPFDERLMHVLSPYSQPAGFMRRSALAEPMLDESFHFALDYELWLRLLSQGRRFGRIGDILAIDRHQPERKSLTMKRVYESDLARLAEAYGVDLTQAADEERSRFYRRQRLWGAMLIPGIGRRKLAFTAPRDFKRGLWRRQVGSRRSTWPEEYR